jgi:hypothetical protein
MPVIVGPIWDGVSGSLVNGASPLDARSPLHMASLAFSCLAAIQTRDPEAEDVEAI